jgi:signal recognition particle subunit SRP68
VLVRENVKDVRYLHIPLVMAERAWAYFMQLKEESKTQDRKKFHMISRLRKATKHAEELKELVGSDGILCDERTELEVTAYSAWLRATLSLEVAPKHETQAAQLKEWCVHPLLPLALPCPNSPSLCCRAHQSL